MEADRQLEAGLLRNALIVSQILDSNSVSKLLFANEDRDSEAFRRIEIKMRELSKTIQKTWAPAKDFFSIYTLKKRNNVIVFGPESLPDSSRFASSPGEIYKNPPQKLNVVFEQNRPVFIDFYRDEYGSFISSFAPLLTDEGQPTGVVIGMDILAQTWGKEKLVRAFLIIGLFSFFGVFLVIIIKKNRDLQLQKTILQESESRNKALLKGIPDLIFVISKDGYYLDYNAHKLSDLLLPPEAFLDKHISEVLPAPLAELTVLNLEKTFKSGETQTYSYSLTLKGESKQYEARLVLVSDENVLAIIRDITAQKMAEMQLSESETRFREMFLRNPQSVQLVDLNGFTLEVNEAFIQLFGSRPPADFSVFNDPILERQGLSALWEKVRNGEVVTFPDFQYDPHEINPSSSHNPLCIKMTVFSLPDSNGLPTKFVLMHDDITNSKKLEEALIQQTRLRDLLMQISAEFINIPLEQFEVAVRKALERIALFVNADRSYIFDYDWDKKTFTNTYEWVAEDIAPEINNRQNLPIDIVMEMVYLHKKGEPMYLPDINALSDNNARDLAQSQGMKSVLTVPMMNKDNCIGFVGFDYVRSYYLYSETETQLLKIFAQMLVNVRLRKEIVEQLIAAKEKAEEMNKVKSNFFANMSHELRTPFVGIIGFAEILASSLKDPDDLEMVNGILKSSERMQDTLSKILSLSKLESDAIRITENYFELNEVITGVFETFRGGALHKKLSYNLRINFDKIVIFSDEGIIKDILQNLISNAIKYTHKGQVEVTANIERRNFTDYFVVKVSDTGIGIPDDKIKLIWEPFRQVSEGYAREFEGVGLGLAIVKKSAELLGGKISAESSPGNGSVFTFELPIKISGGNIWNNDDNRPNSEPMVTGKKILHIEDDFFSQELVRRLLSPFNKLDSVKTPEEALQRVKAENYDALLMDINLGMGMNGITLIKEIRKLPGYESLPIIAVTAYASDEDRLRFLSEGFTGYLSKPFRKKELINILLTVF